jgi:hypothetical protein
VPRLHPTGWTLPLGFEPDNILQEERHQQFGRSSNNSRNTIQSKAQECLDFQNQWPSPIQAVFNLRLAIEKLLEAAS